MEGSKEPEGGTGARGTMRQLLQRDIVHLHKEFMGRGPIKTKLYINEDTILVLLLNGHTPSEQTMYESGGARSVAQTRVDLSESIRKRFIECVERHTGREVVGFMSSSQQHPDLLSQVYVLKPTDLLTLVPDEQDEN